MIAKGNIHADGAKLAAYLVKGDPGERAELIHMEGFAARDLRDGCRVVQITARKDTNCVNPFFHGYTRFAPGEMHDTPENRKTCLEIVQRERKALGFGDQPFAVS